MKVTQMPPVPAANLVANRSYGVGVIISLVCFANNAIHPWPQVMPIFDREMHPGFTPICLRRNFVYISNLENRGDKSLDQNF